jgi:hypothetical protein
MDVAIRLWLDPTHDLTCSTVRLPAGKGFKSSPVNGAAIFLKSGAAKFPSLAGLGCQPCG